MKAPDVHCRSGKESKDGSSPGGSAGKIRGQEYCGEERLGDLIARKMERFRSRMRPDYLKTGIMVLLAACAAAIACSPAYASERLAETLEAYLQKHYPWADVEVQDLSPDGTVPDMKPERIMVAKGLPNRTVFAVEYPGGERLTVMADVKAFDWVIMPRRAFPKGHTFAEEDLYRRLMDVTRIPKDAVTGMDDAVGKSLTRSVVANMPVKSAMITEGGRVKRGKQVTILFESGGLRLSARGETKENAYVGNLVRVVNSASKKVVAGRLIDEHTVKVEF